LELGYRALAVYWLDSKGLSSLPNAWGCSHLKAHGDHIVHLWVSLEALARWTPSLRDLLRRSVSALVRKKRPRYRIRSVHQIRPEAGFGPKMGPGPKKADFGRGGPI
jgi:hypothetical protein